MFYTYRLYMYIKGEISYDFFRFFFFPVQWYLDSCDFNLFLKNSN